MMMPFLLVGGDAERDIGSDGDGVRTALAGIIAVCLIIHGGVARAYLAVGVGTSNREDWTSARRHP